MITSERILCWLAAVAVCSLFLTAGCPQPIEQAVELQIEPEKQAPEIEKEEGVILALKFAKGDLTTYKVVKQTEKTVEFEGSWPEEAAFEGGRSTKRLEMTFDQQIQGIDSTGSGVAKITIKKLKYYAAVKDEPLLDFDSSTEKDPNVPLAKLIGQSYTIAISPTGFVKIIDVAGAKSVIEGDSLASQAALNLFKPVVINEIHMVAALPADEKLRPYQTNNWSNTKTFSLELLGHKLYERMYTLKEIQDTDTGQVAIVNMHAIPASSAATETEQRMGGFSSIFANTNVYTGRMKFDLTAGRVEKYTEQLKSEWVALDPAVKEEDDKVPAVLKMAFSLDCSLERLD